LPPPPSSWREAAVRLSVIHRLAVLLNRSRSTRELPQVDFEVSGESLELRFPDGWLTDNPLTFADLSREKIYLGDIGFGLSFS
jgi:exopolyphosphatase/guanosine-5'-triphosphate,3'-diphosphate pyrophosphatase